MKVIPRIFTLLLCVAMVAAGCITTEMVGPNGEIIKTRSIDRIEAMNLLMLAIDAFDLITARIAAYEAQGEDISEPDAFQLRLALASERFLDLGIQYIEDQLAQLAPGEQKIRVPVGLMRRTAEAASAETGIPLRMSRIGQQRPSIGFEWTFASNPLP